MLILIGPRSDPETLNLSESYPAFFLEDYGTGWEIHVECGAWTLRDHAGGKTLAVDDSLKIFLRNLPQDLPLTTRIMIEALQCMEQARFVGEHACDSPSTWNKPLQLALFGRMAPLTRIVNKTIEASPRTFVVKGMSTIRTRADFYETHLASRPCIEFPTMVQEALSGTEYKTHYLSENGREFFLTVMIKPQDDSLDKRYSDEGLAFTVVQDTPEPIQELCRSLSEATHCKFFDVDFFALGGENEPQFKVLEWNDSPCLTYFEQNITSEDAMTRILKRAGF